MSIPTTDQAIAHCRADPVEDAALIDIYLSAAVAAAQDFLGAAIYADAEAAAGDANGVIADGAVRAAILLICGHLYANREAVVVGSTAVDLPLGAHDLLRPKRRSFGL